MLLQARLVVLLAVLSALTGTSASGTSKCQRCKRLVEGFREGEKRTARSSFGGGDVHWEERKKVAYSVSETRLVEILESACEAKNHACTSFLEDNEELLEHWWFKKQEKYPDLQDWLCRVRLQVCCRDNEFGKNCTPCPGGVENPCSGSGSCDGAGDRTGSGTCHCRYGHTGDVCQFCKPGFFNETKINECLDCHRACLLNCTGAWAEHCLDCDPGWRKMAKGGCEDIDECTEVPAPEDDTDGKGRLHNCLSFQYCVNKEGSFSCDECHTSCQSCTGPGPKACKECKDGYRHNTDTSTCDDIDECVEGIEETVAGHAGDSSDHSTPPTMSRAACDAMTQICFNEPGSFACRCNRGYKRVQDICVVDPNYNEKADQKAADSPGTPDSDASSAASDKDKNTAGADIQDIVSSVIQNTIGGKVLGKDEL